MNKKPARDFRKPFQFNIREQAFQKALTHGTTMFDRVC